MNPQIMVNGLPGNMAKGVVKAIDASEDLDVFTAALCAQHRDNFVFDRGDGKDAIDVRPFNREVSFFEGKPNVAVDYTSPDTIYYVVEHYCEHNVPFVMGTTGGDRAALEKLVRDSNTVAVIAPNMAAPIVGIQHVMERFADLYEGILEDCKLEITESHQKGKKDTSGTAKAMISHFNKLGINFSRDDIRSIRDEETQLAMGIPEEHLAGHGWHTYRLTAPTNDRGLVALELALGNFLNPLDEYEETFYDMNPAASVETDNELYSVSLTESNTLTCLSLTHNVNGRDVYFDGTLGAVRFLLPKIEAGEKGKCYSMIDVLKGN